MESQSLNLVHEIVAAHNNKLSICCDQYHNFPRLPLATYKAGINFLFSSIHRTSLLELEIGHYCHPNALLSAVDKFKFPNLIKLKIWDDGRYTNDATFRSILKQSSLLQEVNIITWQVNHRSAMFTAENRNLVNLKELHIKHGDPDYNEFCIATVISPTGVEEVNLCPGDSDGVDTSMCRLDISDVTHVPNLNALSVDTWCPFDSTHFVIEEGTINALYIEVHNSFVWNSLTKLFYIFKNLQTLNLSYVCNNDIEVELEINFSMNILEELSISSSGCLKVVLPTFLNLPSLSIFELTNCTLEGNFHGLENDVPLPKLNSITLHRSYVSNAFGSALARMMHGATTRKLSIIDAPKFGDQGLKHLLHAGVCKNLLHLSLVNLGISTHSTNILKSCFLNAVFVHVDLSHNEAIDDHVINELFSGEKEACLQLESFNLIGTSISGHGLDTLLKHCLKTAMQLRRIWIPIMDFSSVSQIETLSAVKIDADHIFINFDPNFKQPSRVYLSNCCSNPHIAKWLHLFLANGYVFELNIRDCPALSDDGIKEIFHNSGVCLGLEYLTLEGVGITDAAVSAIWWCIREARSLRVLNLSRNHLTDEGVAELFRDPSVCRNIIGSEGAIGLSGNELSNSGYVSLIPCLMTRAASASDL